MRGDLSRTTKSFQNELRLIDRINSVRLKVLHFDIVQNVCFQKNFTQKLFDMNNGQSDYSEP